MTKDLEILGTEAVIPVIEGREHVSTDSHDLHT